MRTGPGDYKLKKCIKCHQWRGGSAYWYRSRVCNSCKRKLYAGLERPGTLPQDELGIETNEGIKVGGIVFR